MKPTPIPIQDPHDEDKVIVNKKQVLAESVTNLPVIQKIETPTPVLGNASPTDSIGAEIFVSEVKLLFNFGTCLHGI